MGIKLQNLIVDEITHASRTHVQTSDFSTKLLDKIVNLVSLDGNASSQQFCQVKFARAQAG